MSVVYGRYYLYNGTNQECLYILRPGDLIQAGEFVTDHTINLPSRVRILNYTDYEYFHDKNWVYIRDLLPVPVQSCLEV